MSPLCLKGRDQHGNEVSYKVGKNGVQDWGGRITGDYGNSVPTWIPTTVCSDGQSCITGHNYIDGTPQEVYIARPFCGALPFDVLDSATTTS
jgi:hypothetical protein